MAAYGPKALKMTGEEADGFILQLSDLYLTEYMVKAVKDAAVAAGRDPSEVKICVAAPAYVTEDDSPEALAHAREQCRWFGGMVGNHVADLVSKYGEHSAAVPEELTDYIKAREGYDYSHHGRADNPDTQFVPDEIVDRFCVIGTPETHIEKLNALRELGVDQFAVYDMHDAQERVIDAYGSTVIPALNGLNRAPFRNGRRLQNPATPDKRNQSLHFWTDRSIRPVAPRYRPLYCPTPHTLSPLLRRPGGRGPGLRTAFLPSRLPDWPAHDRNSPHGVRR